MDISLQQAATQLMLGLNNGVFYSMLSLGVAVVFGLLRIINFAHGAFYMLGAFVSLLGLSYLGPFVGIPALRLNYWSALIVAPLVVALIGILVEVTLLRRLYGSDPLDALLFTLGLALVLQGVFSNYFNVAGTPYEGKPELLGGAVDLGFMLFPAYRLWSIAVSLFVCFATWYAIERTQLGSYLRAATENPVLVRAFGINVPLMITLTFGYSVGLAALAGVLAAPIYAVTPVMGSRLIVVVFAVVVVGGMGSILGSIVSGLMLGVAEGVVKVVYPSASGLVVFVMMTFILLVRPQGLFGSEQ